MYSCASRGGGRRWRRPDWRADERTRASKLRRVQGMNVTRNPAMSTPTSARPHQPDEDRFHAIHAEDIEWKPFPAFPLDARLAILVGDPGKTRPYVIRVKLPAGTKICRTSTRRTVSTRSCRACFTLGWGTSSTR